MRGARHLCRWCVGRSRLGVHRPDLPLLGHLAIGNQYRDDNCNLPDGFPDSEHPESRL